MKKKKERRGNSYNVAMFPLFLFNYCLMQPLALQKIPSQLPMAQWMHFRLSWCKLGTRLSSYNIQVFTPYYDYEEFCFEDHILE